MDNKQLLYLIEHPEKAGPSDLASVKQWVDTHPYFQAARILYLKLLAISDYTEFIKELPFAAIYAGNRKKLYYYIHPKKTVFSSKTKEEKVETIKVKETATETMPDETGAKKVEKLAKQVKKEETKKLKEVVSDIHIEKEKIDSAAQQPKTETSETSAYNVSYVENEEDEQKDKFEYAVSDTFSFTGWLETLAKPVAESHGKITQDYDLSVLDEKRPKKGDGGKWNLIEDFINDYTPSKPKLRQSQPSEKENIDLSSKSSKQGKEIITETLAGIYLKQKRYDKAIELFEKLRLKYPEKNTYFAGQIKNAKNLKKNN